jgi:hypothetical protein
MPRVFSAFLFCLAILPELGYTQSFTMITQRFNSTSNDWADTIRVSSYWKNVDGSLDSMIYKDLSFPHYINKYCGWLKLPLSYTHSWEVPRQFVQLGTQGAMPLTQWVYEIRETDTILMHLLSSAFHDGWRFDSLTSAGYDYEGNPVEWITYAYGHTADGDFSSYGSFDYLDPLSYRLEHKLIWTYDSINRPVKVVRGIYDPHIREFTASDSQEYSFGRDGNLERAIYVKTDGTQMRFEYFGWNRFEKSIYPFNGDNPPSETMHIWIGGENYLNYSLYTRNSDSIAWDFQHRRHKMFDKEDHLLSDIIADSLQNSNIQRWTYYENGDLKEYVHYRSNTNTFSVHDSIVNVYEGQNLVSSVHFSLGKPQLRYLFDYPETMSVSTTSATSPLFSSSRLLQIEPEGHHAVRVANCAGMLVNETQASARSLDLSFLPSGLYFISIDGGKPRKHLIP